ncbi:MAG: TolC family protein [Chitinophagaceae bacterium]|nr:TolC family protein [Chitinophagaceae bacterium]
MKNLLLTITLLGAWSAQAQVPQTMGLDSIYAVIRQGNASLKYSDAVIRSLDEAAKGARNWEAPLVSTGLWMTPYNPNLWKRQTDGSPGMGQYMISAEQMIPNRRRLDAEEAYMKGMSSVEKERKGATLNELYAAAKQSYYQWMMDRRKLMVLDQDQLLLDFMIKDAELKYKNNLGKISAYYKAKAALGNLEDKRLELENNIVQKRVILNTLMNREKSLVFDIDTAYVIKDLPAFPVDSSFLKDARSDIRAVQQDIQLAGLQQQAERMKLKPEFGVRFDHMFGFGGVPMQYSLMGMVRLPVFGWTSRAVRANIGSLKWREESLRQEKEKMINDAEGLSYGLQQEILSQRRRIRVLEEKVIPSLQKNFQTMQLAYEQNTEELFTLYDAWEALNNAQLSYWDQVRQVLLMQVELERILEIK